MKVLILSQTPWRNDNSFGSSYTGIFGGMKGFEFANIYCRPGLPQNDICKSYFYISEKALVKNLFDKSVSTGEVVDTVESADTLNEAPKVYTGARRLRWQIFYWAQGLLWSVSRWKSRELIDFIDAFDADVLFFPLYYSTYLNKIARFIVQHTGKKLILYVSDDVYTLRQFSLSPLFWINRFIIRPKVKDMVKRCEILYVISEVQREAYARIFGKETRVLTKGADFSGEPKTKKPSGVLRLLYTGNIGSGRWKVLGIIAKALVRINQSEKKAQLDIYTPTPVTRRMRAALDVAGCSAVHGAVSSAEVKKLQTGADVLVHVESFELKERLKVYHSFSTKIVDYAHRARCIFAAGPGEVASIRSLVENDMAVAATKKSEIAEKLAKLTSDPEMIAEYADKAWGNGAKYYGIKKIHTMLQTDIQNAVDKQ